MSTAEPARGAAHAIVTGAGGHLGSAVCRALAADGLTVLGVYATRVERARRTQRLVAEDGGRMEVVGADLTDADGRRAVLAAARELGPAPAALVCAHGAVSRDGVVGAVPDDALWRVNVSATTALARDVGRAMLRRRYGRIVVVGSRAGVAGMPGQAGYAATKAAVSAWAASAAWELGAFGVTVNVVAPGAVTPDPDAPAFYSADQDRIAVERTALRRLATPDDVAGAVRFLAGRSSGYVTGQTLLVDGGARW